MQKDSAALRPTRTPRLARGRPRTRRGENFENFRARRPETFSSMEAELTEPFGRRLTHNSQVSAWPAPDPDPGEFRPRRSPTLHIVTFTNFMCVGYRAGP